MFQLLCLGEDQDEDHPYEESWLLGIGADTSVTHDANGKSCHGHGAMAHWSKGDGSAKGGRI